MLVYPASVLTGFPTNTLDRIKWVKVLSTLRLVNFRCFTDHEIDLQELSVIVGANNAGKTTIAEALRLVSLVTSRYTSLPYHDPPDWLDVPRRLRGCRPSIEGLQVQSDTIFNRYGDPPAKITATFDSVASLEIYIGPDAKIHSVIRNDSGDIIRNKGQAFKLSLPKVNILPQVGPLQRSEQILDRDYVRRTQSSHLAPQHFRNQLKFAERRVWKDFMAIVEDTWPGLQVRGLRSDGTGGPLVLEVRDRDFVAEVGVMGHGLQMWMQTMWFLASSTGANTVILDEPDVYMHADLQRRLIRFLRNRFPQTIITTHSTEIMSEVDHTSIVVVDWRRPRSQRVNSLPGLQSLLDRVGSVHNIHLTRLWTARRFLVVEGEDLKLLRLIQDVVFPRSQNPFDALPSMELPGWGAWSWVVGSQMLLRNAADEAVRVMCILDSDYHTPEQVAERKRDADKKGVWLHIWSRKEIENYLLVPSAIARLIANSAGKRTKPPAVLEVEERLNTEAEGLIDYVRDNYAEGFYLQDKAAGVGRANRKARELILRRSEEEEGRIGLAPGKELFSRLSKWSQMEFGVSISVAGVARAIRQGEVHRELYDVVSEIEEAGDG